MLARSLSLARGCRTAHDLRLRTLVQSASLHVFSQSLTQECHNPRRNQSLNRPKWYSWSTIKRPPLVRHSQSVRHGSSLAAAIPPVLVPPVVLVGLMATLWAYKCVMMIVFQDKIIYMPYVPPFARSEKIEDYAASCRPAEWEECRIRSQDGTRISLAIGKIMRTGCCETGADREKCERPDKGPHVVICYFQGNGSSLPPRLPQLSRVLVMLREYSRDSADPRTYTIVALSYRGYWTSSGRATQSGVQMDARAMLDWVERSYPHATLILWGQSIGAGVASTAAATYISQRSAAALEVSGLIMETPFTSIRSMLSALYPQKWLPYRYLWPFLWNHWDSDAALREIASVTKDRGPKAGRLRILLLSATRDEVVPPEEVDKLARLCGELDLDVQRKNVAGALHTEATLRPEGQRSIARFVQSVSDG